MNLVVSTEMNALSTGSDHARVSLSLTRRAEQLRRFLHATAARLHAHGQNRCNVLLDDGRRQHRRRVQIAARRHALLQRRLHLPDQALRHTALAQIDDALRGAQLPLDERLRCGHAQPGHRLVLQIAVLPPERVHPLCLRARVHGRHVQGALLAAGHHAAGAQLADQLMVHGVLHADRREELRHRRGQRQAGHGAAQARPAARNVLGREELAAVLGVLAGQDDGAEEALHHVLEQKLGGQVVLAAGQLEHGHLALLGQRVVDLGGDALQIGVGHQLAEHKVHVRRVGGHLLGHIVHATQVDVQRLGDGDRIGAAAVRVQLVLDLAPEVLGRDVLLAVDRVDDVDQVLFDQQIDHLDAVRLGQSGGRGGESGLGCGECEIVPCWHNCAAVLGSRIYSLLQRGGELDLLEVRGQTLDLIPVRHDWAGCSRTFIMND